MDQNKNVYTLEKIEEELNKSRQKKGESGKCIAALQGKISSTAVLDRNDRMNANIEKVESIEESSLTSNEEESGSDSNEEEGEEEEEYDDEEGVVDDEEVKEGERQQSKRTTPRQLPLTEVIKVRESGLEENSAT